MHVARLAGLWLILSVASSIPSAAYAQAGWTAAADGIRARLIVEPVGLPAEGRFVVALEIESVQSSAVSIVVGDPIVVEAEVTDAGGNVVPVLVGLPSTAPRRVRTITIAPGAIERVTLSTSSDRPGLSLPWREWTLTRGRYRIVARCELGRMRVELPGVVFEVRGP